MLPLCNRKKYNVPTALRRKLPEGRGCPAAGLAARRCSGQHSVAGGSSSRAQSHTSLTEEKGRSAEKECWTSGLGVTGSDVLCTGINSKWIIDLNVK